MNWLKHVLWSDSIANDTFEWKPDARDIWEENKG